jgi:hypothetical protein
MRSNIEGARMRKTVQEDAETNIVQYLTTGAGPITITQNSPGVLSFDPATSAVNVVMYVPVPSNVSVQHTIINRAAATGTLVVKQADGSTTAGTIAVGKPGIAVWNGNPTSPTTSGWVVSSFP